MVVSEGVRARQPTVACEPTFPMLQALHHAKGSSKGSRIHPAGRHATDGHEPRQVRKEAAISDAGCVVLRCRLPVFRGPFRGPLA
jgi:hypothetical protein